MARRVQAAPPLTRVLIVAAAPDHAGDVVGQIVVIADVTQRPAAAAEQDGV